MDRDVLSEIQSRLSRYLADVRSELDKDSMDLIEQVVVLITGGVLGGEAHNIAQSSGPIWIELLGFIVLLLTGIMTVGAMHITVATARVSAETDD